MSRRPMRVRIVELLKLASQRGSIVRAATELRENDRVMREAEFWAAQGCKDLGGINNPHSYHTTNQCLARGAELLVASEHQPKPGDDHA